MPLGNQNEIGLTLKFLNNKILGLAQRISFLFLTSAK